jgi:pimeloyl-ACP methyl ester carboxylesterase
MSRSIFIHTHSLFLSHHTTPHYTTHTPAYTFIRAHTVASHSYGIMLQDMMRFVEDNGFSPENPLSLVGHSMGGKLALLYSLMFGQNVARCVV